jgi:hypothetical protein
MTYLLAFAAMSALLVHTALYHGKTIWKNLTSRVEEEDIHSKLMKFYPEVPTWWYAVMLFTLFIVGVINTEASRIALEKISKQFPGYLSRIFLQVWKISLPVWGLVLAIAIPTIYIIPACFITAMSGFYVRLFFLHLNRYSSI